MYKTEKERKEARRLSQYRYNRTEKRKLLNKRYRDKHKKQCSQWTLEWTKKNRERVNQSRRIRYATPEGRKIRRAIEIRYNAKNHIKRIAKDAVHNAIMAKKMVKQPCSVCGLIAEGHHPDYTKSLEVVWLCQKHHVMLHEKLRRNLQK